MQRRRQFRRLQFRRLVRWGSQHFPLRRQHHPDKRRH
jgi:hypothetical protein